MKPWIPAIVLSLLAGNVWAGIYVPGEKPSFPVSEDGQAKALPFESFDFLLSRARNGYVPDPAKGPEWEHAQLLRQIRRLERSPTANVATLTAREIQAGLFDQAMNKLRDPLVQRQEPFFAYSHLAWVQFLTGGYADARTRQFDARSLFPKQIDAYTDAQRGWYRQLEREYLIRLFHGRERDPKSRKLDAIFSEPIRFTDADGTYHAGSIPASEKAKLPSDAIAIVQQLVLWAPGDARLFWLLGELYNAEGQIEAARSIFDNCVQSLNYQNEELREHRRIIIKEIEKRRADANAKPDPGSWLPTGPTLWAVLGGTAVVLLALGVWQVRELRRRWRR